MDGIVINKTWVQGKRPEPDCLGEFAYQGENLAHTIKVSGKTAAGTAVNITGTIKGVYLGENNVSVPLTGSVNDGVASLTLTDDCYAIPGKFILSIYAQNTETLCIYCGIGHMFRTESERVPATLIPDVLELIDRAQEVIDSIPEDYTELSNDVVNLKSAMPSIKTGSIQVYMPSNSAVIIEASITFQTPFTFAPFVTLTLCDKETDETKARKYIDEAFLVSNVTANGFKLRVVRGDTTSYHTAKVEWLAIGT